MSLPEIIRGAGGELIAAPDTGDIVMFLHADTRLPEGARNIGTTLWAVKNVKVP